MALMHPWHLCISAVIRRFRVIHAHRPPASRPSTDARRRPVVRRRRCDHQARIGTTAERDGGVLPQLLWLDGPLTILSAPRPALLRDQTTRGAPGAGTGRTHGHVLLLVSGCPPAAGGSRAAQLTRPFVHSVGGP